MRITYASTIPTRVKAASIILFVPEGVKRLTGLVRELDRALAGAIDTAMREGAFRGKLGKVHAITTHGKLASPYLLLAGIGKLSELDLEHIRHAVGVGVRAAREMGSREVTISIPEVAKLRAEDVGQALVEASLLALYTFRRYKSEGSGKDDEEWRDIEDLTLVAPNRFIAAARRGGERGSVIAEAANWTRDLANEPANVATPTLLAEYAKKLAKELKGCTSKVLERADAEKLKMGAFLGVAKGSQEPPKFIVLEYIGRAHPTIVLVGKGITFDSGGISIKPSAKMEEMKYDMAGGAAVLGAIRVAATLRLPLHLVGLVPAAENLPSGSAQRPGDVVRTITGKTVEVTNTDAEGRLILADALGYAQRYKPDAVIDLATLTGFIVVALGESVSGLYTNSERLSRRLEDAGRRAGEPLWRMPLLPEYLEQMRSEVADLKNEGGREGGAGTAARFLEQFVGDLPWAHLDIAGTAWATKPKKYYGVGATGVGVRLLVEALRKWKK